VFVAFMVICVRNTCCAGRGAYLKRMASFYDAPKNASTAMIYNDSKVLQPPGKKLSE
jgi:hypothetical protein